MKRISQGWKYVKLYGLSQGMKYSPSNKFKQQLLYKISKHKKQLEQNLFAKTVADVNEYKSEQVLINLKQHHKNKINDPIKSSFIDGKFHLLQKMVDRDIHLTKTEFKQFKIKFSESKFTHRVGLRINQDTIVTLSSDNGDVWSSLKKWLTSSYYNIIEEGEYKSDDINKLKGEQINSLEIFDILPRDEGRLLKNKQVKFLTMRIIVLLI